MNGRSVTQSSGTETPADLRATTGPVVLRYRSCRGPGRWWPGLATLGRVAGRVCPNAGRWLGLGPLTEGGAERPTGENVGADAG